MSEADYGELTLEERDAYLEVMADQLRREG